MARTFRYNPTVCDPDAQPNEKARRDRARRNARKAAQFSTPLRVQQVMRDVRNASTRNA